MSYPLKTVEKSAKSVDEALDLALKELGVGIEEVDYYVVDEPSKGLFGLLGGKEARVRVSIKEGPRQRAVEFLEELLFTMGIRAKVEAEAIGSDQVNINISGEDMGIIIGKRGETLDAIQYLTSLVVNKTESEYIRVSIDTENYRQKRKESLIALANRIAGKVSKSGKRYTLEPMSAYERRIIHFALQENGAVATHSIGEEPYRKIVVVPNNR